MSNKPPEKIKPETTPNHKGSTTSPSDYVVGHGRPPKAHQFKPGQSGNAKGRPKGSRNMKTDLDVALKARMSVTKNGRAVTMSTQQVLIAKLIEKSLKGDIRSLSKLFDLIGTHLTDEETNLKAKPVSQSDAQILEAFKKSLGEKEENDD